MGVLTFIGAIFEKIFPYIDKRIWPRPEGKIRMGWQKPLRKPRLFWKGSWGKKGTKVGKCKKYKILVKFFLTYADFML